MSDLVNNSTKKIKETINKTIATIKGDYYKNSILALELTDFCNCSCVMCTQSVSQIIHGKSKGFMGKDLFNSILDSIKRKGYRFGKLLPFGLGESLLHPDFNEMLKTILEFNKNKRYFDSVDLHTNAILMDRGIIDILLNSSSTIDTLSFSLDAVTTDTYYKIRRNRSLEKAYENIKLFFKKRKELGKSKPKAHLQFIVMKENRHEAKAFLDYWSEFLDSLDIEFQVNYDWFPPMQKDTIFFKKLTPFKLHEFEEAELIHKQVARELGLLKNNGEFDLQKFSFKKRRPCSGPFKYMSISWDGVLTVCCIDTGRELALGNVKDCDLFELWEGEKNKQYRLWHILGEFENMPKCTICSNLDWPIMNDDEIVSYLKGINREDLIKVYYERLYDK